MTVPNDELHLWLQGFSIGLNITLLVLTGVIVRKFTIIEERVNQMWAVFSRRFGTRIEKSRGDE